MFDPADDGAAWRRDLRLKVALALAAKLAGLFVLWWLFFRGPSS
jgi:hypothetical protein